MSKSNNAWEGLEALDRKLRDAESREAEVRARSGAALRAVSAARAKLVDYSEAVYKGDREEDPGEETSLIQTISEAEGATSSSVSEARSEAAERTRSAAEFAVRSFEAEHLEELLGDHAPRAYAAAEELERSYATREAAEREYAVAQRRSFRLAAIAGLSAEDVPRNPLAGDPGEIVERFARGIEPPLPRALIEAYMGSK